VHDRRIDGATYTFGNAGALVMNAMTWFDHETDSIWSQPVGLAFRGPLQGTRLELLPFQLTTWSNWFDNYPDTLVMINDFNRLGNARQGFRAGFVVALVLDNTAKAYYYDDVENANIINDNLADTPVVVWAENNNYNAFVRKLGDQLLTFALEAGEIVDLETGSTWDMSRGLAKGGPLAGEGLQSVPSLSSYDWAFRDFYPESDIYQP
jgi:hypothetical protein